jgi:hypothetical protein
VDESGKQVINEVEKEIKTKKYVGTYNQFAEGITIVSALSLSAPMVCECAPLSCMLAYPSRDPINATELHESGSFLFFLWFLPTQYTTLNNIFTREKWKGKNQDKRTSL